MTRIPFGSEKRFGTHKTSKTCHDCGVRPGRLHKAGCDWEECEHCGRQRISCLCNYRWTPKKGLVRRGLAITDRSSSDHFIFLDSLQGADELREDEEEVWAVRVEFISLVRKERPPRRCRKCGCTDTTPCMTSSGPCAWVEPDLCSACTKKSRTKKKVRR